MENNAALRTILPIAGWAEERARDVEISSKWGRVHFFEFEPTLFTRRRKSLLPRRSVDNALYATPW